MHQLPAGERPLVYERLVRGFAAVPAVPQSLDERWVWLMAAHVVGQHQARLHFDSHRRMLGLAKETRDWGEVAGQALRIALLPLGHLLGKIPRGNIGRATVGVTQVMEPPETVQRLIDWAVLASLIETCKLNGVDPQAYLADVTSRIVQGHPNSGLDALLPWAYRSEAATTARYAAKLAA